MARAGQTKMSHHQRIPTSMLRAEMLRLLDKDQVPRVAAIPRPIQDHRLDTRLVELPVLAMADQTTVDHRPNRTPRVKLLRCPTQRHS